MAKQTPVTAGAVIALGYIAVTLPFLETDFLGRGLYAGPGCCFLLVMGLLFGQLGVWGCLAGCIGGILIRFQSIQEAVFLFASAAWLSICPWFLWYRGKNARQMILRTGRDFTKYVIIALAASGGTGLICGIYFKSPVQMAEAAVFTFFWCIAAGIPSIILLLSILGIQVHCPPSARIPDDLALQISGKREEIGMVNDRIEDLCQDKGLDIRASYRLMSCLEELLLRIMEHGNETAEIQIHVRICETVILSVTCCGPPYNPLRIESREQMEDLIGLKLIRQMSLRASYRRVQDENQIKIVM